MKAILILCDSNAMSILNVMYPDDDVNVLMTILIMIFWYYYN